MKNKIRTISLASSLAVLSACQADVKPNILIIQTDEQNFRTLGCYRDLLSSDQALIWGEEAVVETPNIDYLASEGILFKNCYATTPVSSPSRASFLTGLYPQNAGVPRNDLVLNETAKTFGETLREEGYVTGYLGKLHLNGTGRPEWGPGRDFGFTDNKYMYNRGHWKKIVETDDGPQFMVDDHISTTDSLSFTTDFLTDRAIDFINQHKDTSFCCMLSLPDPHGPNLVRSPYDTMYSELEFNQPHTAHKDTTGLPIWSYGGNFRGDRMENMARYYGMIKCIDDNIGKLLTTLKENGILDKTIVIFTSDHGDLCGEHGLVNKGVPLDGSAKIPFIISYPKKSPRGKVVERVMSVVDFVPSLLSYCGIKSEQKYEGRDLSSLWEGGNLSPELDDAIYMRAITRGESRITENDPVPLRRSRWLSIVTPEYKLTFSENETDLPWLTDLKSDPDELINCFDDPSYDETLKSLTKRLLDYGNEYNDPRIRNQYIKKTIDNILN